MWIEFQENTKLVTHAPRSTSQNYTTDYGQDHNVRSVSGECVVENRIHMYHHCLCECLMARVSLLR